MYQRGDVIAVSFPFTDLKSSKLRPALVISNADQLKGTNDVIIVMITSRFHSDGLNIPISKSDFDFELPKQSYIRCHRIATIDTAIVKGKIGNASANIVNQVAENITGIISDSSDIGEIIIG
jgi:mRNA interferase MazF